MFEKINNFAYFFIINNYTLSFYAIYIQIQSDEKTRGCCQFEWCTIMILIFYYLQNNFPNYIRMCFTLVWPGMLILSLSFNVLFGTLLYLVLFYAYIHMFDDRRQRPLYCCLFKEQYYEWQKNARACFFCHSIFLARTVVCFQHPQHFL